MQNRKQPYSGPKLEDFIPKELVEGRSYHVSGWKRGSVFVLIGIDGDKAHLMTPATRLKYTVDKSLLRNTKRHQDK